MKLHVFGANGPYPESGGATSGYLLEAGGELIQFDMGSGVLARLTARTAPESVSALFLSHWHYDHAADLTVLMYRLQFTKRKLRIFAPADPDAYIRRITADADCFELRDVKPGDVISVGDCRVRVGEARHPVPAVGYLVEAENRRFGYTGDTNVLPSLTDFFRGCDLLLADGMFAGSHWDEGKPHLSAELAASLAADAGAKRLVITHLNPVYDPGELLREAQERFPDAVLARAGEIIPV